MWKKYQDRAQFLIVYIKEAHPAEDWPMRVNARLKFIQDPTSDLERLQVASTCVADLDISIPCVIDDMNNSTAAAYKGHPDRLYVVGRDGKIAYHGDPGPMGFKPSGMEMALELELDRIAELDGSKTD